MTDLLPVLKRVRALSAHERRCETCRVIPPSPPDTTLETANHCEEAWKIYQEIFSEVSDVMDLLALVMRFLNKIRSSPWFRLAVWLARTKIPL